MSTKLSLASIAPIVMIALLASPCAAQIFYVRDAAGYVRPVVIPQPTAFGMSMQVQPVVSPDGMFVRMNFSQLSVSMPDPTATTFLVVPGPNLGIFRNGVRQPATIANKPIVIPLGAQATFGQSGFGQSATSFGAFSFARGSSASSFGTSSFGAQVFVGNASAMFQPSAYAMPMESNRFWLVSGSSTAQTDTPRAVRPASVFQADSWRTMGPSYFGSTWTDSLGIIGPAPNGSAWTNSFGTMQHFTASRLQ